MPDKRLEHHAEALAALVACAAAHLSRVPAHEPQYRGATREAYYAEFLHAAAAFATLAAASPVGGPRAPVVRFRTLSGDSMDVPLAQFDRDLVCYRAAVRCGCEAVLLFFEAGWTGWRLSA